LALDVHGLLLRDRGHRPGTPLLESRARPEKYVTARTDGLEQVPVLEVGLL
jgi:hypothetical protein